MTLPDTKTGFVLASGAALGVRMEGVLREDDPEPVDPPPRCAVAVDTNKAITIINRALDLDETNAMAASILKIERLSVPQL
jgi:hypothetical protein